MSFALARAQIVSILEATSLSYAHEDLPATLQHVSESSEADAPAPRGFWLEASARGIDNPLGALSRAHTVADLSVVVFYADIIERGVLDVAIAQDYDDIARTLADPAQWNRPTSTIVALDSAGALLPRQRRPLSGGVLSVLTFPLEYTP